MKTIGYAAQDSSAKKLIALRATSTISRLESKTMIPPAPKNDPHFRMLDSSRVTFRSSPARNPPDRPAIVTA